MSKQFTPAEVQQYNGEKGLYIIVDNAVYNVTGISSPSFPPLLILNSPPVLLPPALPRVGPLLSSSETVFLARTKDGSQRVGVNVQTEFQNEHPGGAKILKRVAGKDASKQFWKYHNESVLKKYGEKLKVGSVKEAAKI